MPLYFLKRCFFRLFFIEVQSCWPFLLISEPTFSGRALSQYLSVSVACMNIFILYSSKFHSICFRWLLPDYVRFLLSRIFVRSRVSDKKSFSLTTRSGSPSLNDALHKRVSPRMQGKRTKIIWRIRELSSHSELHCSSWISSHYSPLQGLILAVKDPKVAIFALMNVSQLLGLSFTQFFPTSEYVLSNCTNFFFADGFPVIGLPRP